MNIEEEGDDDHFSHDECWRRHAVKRALHLFRDRCLGVYGVRTQWSPSSSSASCFINWECFVWNVLKQKKDPLWGRMRRGEGEEQKRKWEGHERKSETKWVRVWLSQNEGKWDMVMGCDPDHHPQWSLSKERMGRILFYPYVCCPPDPD